MHTQRDINLPSFDTSCNVGNVDTFSLPNIAVEARVQKYQV